MLLKLEVKYRLRDGDLIETSQQETRFEQLYSAE